MRKRWLQLNLVKEKKELENYHNDVNKYYV